MPKVAKSKRNVRAKNKNKRNPTISEHTRSTLMTGMQHFPEGGTIRIPDFIAEVANNATLAGIKTGPRLKNYVKRSLYALDRKFKDDEKLIQVDMDRGTLQITPLGYLRFQDILTEVSEHDVEEGRGMICACALAYETRFGPLKLLTNAQMQLFTDRTRRREEELSRKERELELRERQALRRLEPLAGPSTPGVFSNVTPLRKAFSMGAGVYGTPVSLPPFRPRQPGFIPPSPPPSPSPRGPTAATTMDIDAPMEYAGPPSQPTFELEAELADAKADLWDSQQKLAETQNKLADTEARLQNSQEQIQQLGKWVTAHEAQITELEALKRQLQGENAARVQELQEMIDSIRTESSLQASEYEAQIVELEYLRRRLQNQNVTQAQVLQDEIDTLDGLRKEATEEIAGLMSKIRERDARIEELLAQQVGLKQTIRDRDARIDGLVAENTGLKQKLDTWEAECQRDAERLAERLSRARGSCLP